jgi:AraC-like DNA-binding protein
MAPRPQSYTISGVSIASLVGYAKERGADLRGALVEAGLAEAPLMEAECRVELPAAHIMWERAALATHDVDFGLHYAERLDLDAFHVVGHLARTSRTVGEAFERVVAYSRLLHDAGRTELERAGATYLLFPGCRGLPTPPTRHVAEFNTASAVMLTRFVSGRPDWCPQAVAFEHPAPARLVEHRRLFGVTPTFGAPETSLVLDAGTLALPVRESSPSRLGQYLEGYAKALLEALPDVGDDLQGQVLRSLVTGLTHNQVSIEPIAARLGLTPRTLQRRLAEHGTRFSNLVDEARRRTAERYLSDDSLPLAEVSFLLGFKDPSTFHRAFRRWTGKPPGAWREHALRR